MGGTGFYLLASKFQYRPIGGLKWLNLITNIKDAFNGRVGHLSDNMFFRHDDFLLSLIELLSHQCVVKAIPHKQCYMYFVRRENMADD